MPFTEFDVGVIAITGVAVGAVGVAVGVGIHHWFIEDASKAETSDCKSCTLNPVFTPEGSVSI